MDADILRDMAAQKHQAAVRYWAMGLTTQALELQSEGARLDGQAIRQEAKSRCGRNEAGHEVKAIPLLSP